MGDQFYQRKFSEMQKYIPFLERVIEKLKNNDNDKPRKAQLEKMQMLHNLLNNKQKKLKIETLLKCESVLKKLHAKIDKSDELSPPMTLSKPSTTATTTTTTPNTSSVVPKKVQPTTLKSTAPPSASSANKFVSRCNLIEINTCPASPTQLGDEDFRPPVEIPTERRNSPRRMAAANPHSEAVHKPQQELGKPIPTVGPRFQNNRPSDYYHSNYHQLPQQQHHHHHHQQQQQQQLELHHHQPPPLPPPPQHHQHHYPLPAPVNHRSRWADPIEWPPEPQPTLPPSNSSSYNNRSWSSSSSSASSSNHRSHGQPKKIEPKKKVYSSEEENWDDPEDEPTPPPKPAPKAPPQSTSSSSSSHSQHRESSNSSYQHRHHEKNKNHSRDVPPLLPALPDLNLDKDAFQKKLYHDTIFKYKKPDPPMSSFNPFMNPPPPEPAAAAASTSNIFNRLGDKVEGKVDFENFRIEVKNDKMKPKPPVKLIPPPPSHPPPAPPPPPPPAVPFDEVLKSPPLSADDIDDLLNESLEAAIGRPVKTKPIELKQDDKESALEAVRKKLAMISKPARSGLESPPPAANKHKDEIEPFYRRGHTPTKNTAESVKYNSTLPQNSQRELFKPPPPSESTPKSPPNPIDPVIERLALKYNPHRRRDSISAMPQQNNDKPKIQSPPIKDHTIDPIISGGDRLALKYNPHPRRDSMASPLRAADPRVGKMLGQVSPLVTSPIAVSPLANALSTAKPHDPRLRNAPSQVPFCTPIPYTPAIPSLLDMNLKSPLHKPGYPSAKPLYGIPPPSRLDPRTHKVQATVYAEKFNPERNDQTERMKYLESKKKKPPEPKTYGEYRQSKCRQQAAVEAAKVTQVASVPSTTSLLITTPSTIDKMYRNADYSKELGGSIQGFKIPKKPKSEELVDAKVEEPVKQTEEPVKKLEEPVKKLEEPVKKVDEPVKKLDSPVKKVEKAVEPVNELDEPAKAPEEPIESTKSKKKQVGDAKKTTTTLEQSSKEPLKPIDIGDESAEANQDSSLDELKSDGSLVTDDAEDTPKIIVKRSPGRPSKRRLPPRAAKKLDQESPAKLKTEPQANQEDDEDDEEDEIKPRRIGTRRSTILKDRPTPDMDRQSESLSPIPTRCRSASDIFAPTTDNSIVSTQNIIAGKRKTRATINFNEKATKKPVTPKQTQPPVTSPATTPKNRGKLGTKTAEKKSPPVVVATRARRQAGGKQTSDDGQICAVSSTTSQGGDVEDSHNEDTLDAEDVGTPEEPTSSASKPQQAAVIDADENNKKQEWLEGFLKSIVDPSTNKDRILDMLKAVLDDKKLQQVKDILYSPEDEDRDAAVNVKKQPEQSKPRATRTKKNELDRLNEDIRDMFICQGVVTATGRRMCTLAKDTSNVKPVKPKEQPKEKRSLRLKEEPSSATPSPTSRRRMRRAKVIISPLNMRALRSRTQKDGKPPEMPVLEPNTPIKLSGEDDDCEEDNQGEKPARNKPGPKSKRATSLSLESDDDDIQLVHLRKKIKGESKGKQDKVETVELESDEDETDDDETEEDETEEEETDEEIEPTKVETKQEKTEEKQEKPHKVEDKKEKLEKVEAKPEKVIPKNTNPAWHTMSEYASCCVICKEKTRHIAPHYLTSHNDSEVYTSRLPPAVLEDMKDNIGNRALYSIAKKPSVAFHYRCPFCDFQSTSTLRCWMEHFTCHTGEYQHKCSGCYKAMNGSSHMMEHIKKCCPHAKKLNREPVSMRGNFITGFVCHLCNFVQMLRGGVIRHLKVHHDLFDVENISLIREVKLIDTANVPKMEEGKEPKEVNLSTFSPPAPPASKPNESNMQVFLSRELASPTSDVLSERLKSIEQDDGMTSDSSVITISPFKGGQAPAAARITIAERLSQRFKNIDKQNLLEDERVEDLRTEDPVPINPIKANKTDSDAITTSIAMDVKEVSPPASGTADLAAISQTLDDSQNESCNLIIDEQEGDKSPVDGDGSESEWADGNDEDDNENWEDIEITETKGTSQKDKNKNKSIFQTLSRLYASIAPKKGTKKLPKDKEKKKIDTPQMSEKPVQVAKQRPAAAATAPARKPPQISNLSDLLPDSPTDSLDMLLATNFNCLEGDGTSFPHLDLNDLDSPIFLLPGEQTNLQDAIAMATDLDQIKYDVLGNPLPSATNPLPPKSIASPASVQQIGNFGFSLSGNTFKYYCMVKACTFLFSDHPDGLQNHFLLEHPNLKWNGYCHTCKAQMSPTGGREMQHMLDIHSKPKIMQQSGEKPRIKFRRLTGDILSTGKQQPPSPPSLPPPIPVHAPLLSPKAKKSKLCLSTLLQSEPKAMIQPAPPPAFDNDIPLYKNVSKEFTITGVAEGVTDDDLRKLVFNQPESTSGGLQISQVISLNAGGKSVSPGPMLRDFPQIAPEHRMSPAMHLTDSLSHNNSPIHFQSINLPCAITVKSRRNSVVPVANPSPKSHAFKCGATNCQFSSNVRTAMNEHVMFHLRTDNDRGSLKCHECTFAGRSITDYFQHMANGHARPTSKSPCLQTNDLTQKIQDILRATANPCSSKPAEEEKDPLEIPEARNERSFSEKLRQVADEMVAETGMPEEEVWKCPLFPECNKPITEWDFLVHVAKHTTSNNATRLQCPHCTVNYHRAGIMKAHMKTHGRHQYFCYVCCATFSSFQRAQRHFSECHSRYMPIQAQSLILDETPVKQPSFFLISSDKLAPTEVVQFGEKLLAEWERKKSLTKTHFQPHEQYLLPLQPIFNNQVCCSVCNYKTKVRTNMYRHLQLHKQEVDVASVDPVNPVPCLEKNEKHFDKMTNLACSSNAIIGGPKTKESAVKIPVFVPDMRRFVCGHPGCTYLTITDHMLRSHLNALHSTEKGYQCPHCQEDICKKNMCAERIVQHLKFHGSKIYQCGECDYLHYTKHVVERHVNEKHHSVPFVNLMTYDRTEGEINKTTQLIVAKSAIASLPTPAEIELSEAGAANASGTNKCKWECALCKHQTVTWNQMISHANGAHRAKHQYICVHCPFGSAHLAHIMDHIDTKHPTKTREAKYVFYKINETAQDKAADTRPLWSRDDPKRVRSIRGILMENEEDAERTKQSLSNAGVDLDDEDDDVEIIQVIESESAMKPGVLGCFHCDFKSEDMTALTTHWKMKHWHARNHESVPKLPFFFRIHSILKCPSCNFIGDYVSMQVHAFNQHGQRTFCAADPKLPNTCGHCPFVYPPKRLEILTRHYHREHKPTDVKNLSSGLLKSVLALGECQVYMQCYFCAEICADKTAIIDHERERHASSNFRYKQIKDEVIYRCGMCQYSSTNELATLRHMIDHFGGFMHCHFCFKDQTGFNAYMQHCYVSHPKELKDFKAYYTLDDLTAFLGQMLLIFPNGLIVNKRNLIHTQYGSTERILAMYDEICKKALEPPIPPLCMARLMAKKMTEARESTLLLPPPPVPVTAKRIAKRRSTVAISVGDRGLSDFLVPSGPQKIKKRKASISEDRPIPPAPLFSAVTSSASHDEDTPIVIEADDHPTPNATDEGVSFYGKTPEPVDLSKIYTQIAIGDKYAPVSVKKFALLIRMNAKVLVDRMDFRRFGAKRRRKVIGKPCPASKKKFVYSH